MDRCGRYLRTVRRAARTSCLWPTRFCRLKVPRSRRLCLLPASTGFKGFTALFVITLASIVMVLYARDHVQIVMTQAFSPPYVSATSQQHVSPTKNASKPKPAENQGDVLAPDIGGWDTDRASEEKVEADPYEAFPVFQEEDVSLLEEFAPIPDMTLHYLWCGHRFFDFRHYVAMKSAIEAIRPRKVVFHYKHLPMADPDGYFTWFDRLHMLYPNIIKSMVNATHQPCYSGGYKRFALVFDILQRYGGMYLPEDAIFLRFADRFRNRNFVSGISSCNLNYFFEGIAIGRFGQFEVPETEMERVRMLSVCHDQDSLHPCTPEERYLSSPSGNVPSCVRLETALFPKDVWTGQDKVSSLIRLIAYGKTELQPRRSDLAMYRIPRVAHYLCVEDCSLSFSVYLSILSALEVGKLQRVLIHGPKVPSGVWWQRLQHDRASDVHYLHREFTYMDKQKAQISNDMQRYIMRTEILLHYGGVFHDGHVIWTQALPDELLEYEAVASPDWHAHGNWPESVNHALLMARGGATYLQQLLQVYRDNANTGTPWLAEHYLSYRLIELDPTLVYLHPRLQVKCLNHNCHPTWVPDYRSSFLLNRPGPEFDWRRDTLSVHWVDSFPELDVDQVKFTSGFIVDVARHVLRAAGVDLNHLT